MPNENTVPYDAIPEYFRKEHAEDFERLEKLKEALAPHLQSLAGLGFDISYTIPGHPATGGDGFCQDRSGVPMARLAKNERLAFLWWDRDGSWGLRRWMMASRHDDTQIVSCPSLLEALREIAPEARP